MKNFIKIIFLFLFILAKANAIFSEHQAGIIDNIITDKIKSVYLTFDVCSGKNSNTIDMKILDYIIKNKIKTTIFINARFLDIEENKEILKTLSKLEFISIQNHGTQHKPASINGKSIHGITGTKNKQELLDEFILANNKIKDITGKDTRWYRSGTAYYDSEAIKIINENGYKIAGFSLSLDDGSTLKNKEIIKKTKYIKNGDILLGHINHPQKNMFLAYRGLIEFLKKNNFEFLLLE